MMISEGFFLLFWRQVLHLRAVISPKVCKLGPCSLSQLVGVGWRAAVKLQGELEVSLPEGAQENIPFTTFLPNEGH